MDSARRMLLSSSIALFGPMPSGNLARFRLSSWSRLPRICACHWLESLHIDRSSGHRGIRWKSGFVPRSHVRACFPFWRLERQ